MDNGSPPAAIAQAADVADVADVSGAAPGWLREARQLADEYGLDRIVAALDALAAERGRHAFRVALVGEFNRGKSTLVNRLIRRDLLPTGPCPVTRAPVTVRAAPEESVRLTWPDGHREVRSLADGDPWAGLTGTPPSPMPQEGTANAPAPTEPAVVAAVADAWLTELGIELVDLPGVNSGSEEQLEQVRRTAVASDAVLFVVSAVSPMSSTEHRLLQEEVLCRHVPFVAVVVTMLDLVDADDREETVRHLGQRLADLPGPLPVPPAPLPRGGEPELAAVRALVEEFARGSGRALWRDRRIAAQVADHCEAVTGIADEAIAAGRLSRTEVEERAKQAQVLLDKESQQWEQLHLDLTSRQLALADRLRTQIHKERDGLIERLRWELERTQDPGGWWKRDLPVRLRHELSLLAQRSERTVLPGLTADVEWLDAEVAVRLPGASPSHVPAGLGVAVEPQFSGEISDLSRIRLATRLGAQGGAIVGYLIAFARTASTRMIYGAAFSLIGGLLAEGAVRSATEQQRREVDTALVRVVDDSTTAFLRQAVDLLSEIYAEVFDQLRQSRLVWHDARRAALESPAGSGADWQALARSAAALAARIRAELQN